MNTFQTGDHAATLDDASGAGILIAPRYTDHVDGHAAEWTQIIRELHIIGWGPLTDEWDLPIMLARLDNGGTAYALHANDSNDRANDADYDAALLNLIAMTEG